MAKTFFTQLNIDTFGFWASATCAVHCLILPVLLSVGAFGGLAFLDHPYIEGTVITLSAVLAFSSLLPSYFRHHRKFSAIGFVVVGFIMIALSRVVASEFWEAGLTTSGATLVATAHVLNYRLCKHRDSTRA